MTIDASSAGDGFIIARDPAAPPRGLEGAVVAIGNFDGVHRGHQAVLARARALADKLGKPCAVLTFEPHPADFFAGRNVVHRLTPDGAKALTLSRFGVDGMIVLSFGAELARLEAERFVADILLGRLGVSGAVVGYDFHFGRGRVGSPAFLVEAGLRHGFAVEVVEKITADEQGSLDAVHSSGVRAALELGDVAQARRLLGHDFFVLGEIIHGQKLGRTIGFPTANLRIDASSGLRFGIYAVQLKVDGATHDGVASWGRRPTVDNGAPLLEVYVFDFAGDLYGKQVEVDFIEWLRPELKFDGLEALTAQIEKDCEAARAALKRAG
ncbi:MAG: bifunctional riboflavin kinase/FAD synthetase [Beijerinckiaceae bacterium]|nr:bifunctional riboflavin kinase/FAD synthetase [Beijerinckiaceae bacterium]